MKKEYAEEVAAKIIEQLEQGTAPWQKPWKPGELSLPYNASTGKEYRGINSMWLAMQGHSDPRWMTYNQAKDAGGQVRKGSKGTKIVYWKTHDEQKAKDEAGNPIIGEDGEPIMIRVALERPRAFHAVVFNAEQIDGLPPLAPKIITPEPERHARADSILSKSGANIQHVAGDRAFYQPSTDSITLPERSQFDSADGYYATALHELGHWTGHSSRLDRDLAHPFGSEGYAREELRAEISSLMIGERLELGHDPSQHAAYVGSWIKVLKEDPREIFRAAADAERIASYVMAFEHEKTQEQQHSKSAEQQPALAVAVKHHPPENPMPGRTYLAIPYSEKELAKSVAKESGFRLQWDKENKAWFAPAGADLSRMGQWMPDAPRVQTPTTKSAAEQFSDALKEAGLVVDGLPIMDGKIHRVPVEGDRGGEKSGAYAGHMEGRIPGGYIQNYKTGERINWKAEGTITNTTPEERARLAAEAAERQQKRAAEQSQKQQATADAAAALWAHCPPATAENAYCAAKGITDPVGLRTVPEAIPADVAKAHNIHIAKTVWEAKAMREADPDARVFGVGDLLVPGRDMDGKLWTLQSINPGFKSFMKGGRKHGLIAIAGAKEGLNIPEEENLIVAEGYATANTVSKLAGQPVVVAFDSGNLDAVVRELRERFPMRSLMIAADNDHEAPTKIDPNGKPRPNVGMVKAMAAAKQHGAGVVAPTFKPGEKGSDWNDLEKGRGEEDARREFVLQMTLAKQEAAINADRLATLARERDQAASNDPTTNVDDASVAAERGRAALSITSASEQVSDVRNAVGQGLANSKSGKPATASVKASLDRKMGELKDDTRIERQSMQSNAAKKDAAKTRTRSRTSRGRGIDAGM